MRIRSKCRRGRARGNSSRTRQGAYCGGGYNVWTQLGGLRAGHSGQTYWQRMCFCCFIVLFCIVFGKRVSLSLQASALLRRCARLMCHQVNIIFDLAIIATNLNLLRDQSSSNNVILIHRPPFICSHFHALLKALFRCHNRNIHRDTDCSPAEEACPCCLPPCFGCL